MDKIAVTKPLMPSYEEFIDKIKPLWESKWLTNMGVYHKELEERLQDYLSVPYISLMVNGHMALELAIQLMGFPQGSEVITTPFTFISTTHAIIRCGLVPVFCDIKLDYTIDEAKIEALITDKTVAVLPVHVYGNICNVEEIQRIAQKNKLKVIYDAAHAFGETYKGYGIGNFGDVSVFSFHATKVYHTIEGGAASFSESEMYEKLYNLKNFGIRGEEIVADIGANAKMNEFSAIMGLCNLKDIAEGIKARKNRAEYYLDLLEECKHLRALKYDQEDVVYNYGYFPVYFYDSKHRDIVYEKLREKGIYARKYFYPLTSDAAYLNGKNDRLPLENARKAALSVLILPLYPELAYEDIERIVQLVKNLGI